MLMLLGYKYKWLIGGGNKEEGRVDGWKKRIRQVVRLRIEVGVASSLVAELAPGSGCGGEMLRKFVRFRHRQNELGTLGNMCRLHYPFMEMGMIWKETILFT